MARESIAIETGRTKTGRTALVRLLRFVASGAVSVSDSGVQTRLERSDGRVLEVSNRLLRGLQGRGLVDTTVRGDLTLSSAGRAFAKRMLTGGDAAAGFAAQHRLLADEQRTVEGETRSVTVNLSESPLALLARLKGRDGSAFFDTDAVLAGERLRIDFERAQMQPRISANWEASVSRGPRAVNGTKDVSDSAISARRRVDLAVAAIGPELSGVVLDVCCFLKGLEVVERERQWPSRSAKLLLRSGLNTLSRHYGYRT